MENDIDSRRVLNDRGVVVMLALLTLLSLVALCVHDALADPPADGRAGDVVTRLEVAQAWLLRGVRSSDRRHGRVHELARLVAEEAEHYQVDPYLLLATLFAESSLRLGRVGSARGEVGMGQLHGTALVLAGRELRSRGLEAESLAGQVAASAWLLGECHEACGAHEGAHEGAVSRYLTGRCRAGSENVEKKIRYRLSLADILRTLPS